jgi:hypothetical protein
MTFIPIFVTISQLFQTVEMGKNGSLVTAQTPLSFFYEGRLAKNSNARDQFRLNR